MIRICSDPVIRGYNGGISIEPHMGTVFRDTAVTNDADSRFATDVEYRRRMERLLFVLGAKPENGSRDGHTPIRAYIRELGCV